jgi:hypothetical protein
MLVSDNQPDGKPATIKFVTVGGRTSAVVVELQKLPGAVSAKVKEEPGVESKAKPNSKAKAKAKGTAKRKRKEDEVRCTWSTLTDIRTRATSQNCPSQTSSPPRLQSRARAPSALLHARRHLAEHSQKS